MVGILSHILSTTYFQQKYIHILPLSELRTDSPTSIGGSSSSVSILTSSSSSFTPRSLSIISIIIVRTFRWTFLACSSWNMNGNGVSSGRSGWCLPNSGKYLRTWTWALYLWAISKFTNFTWLARLFWQILAKICTWKKKQSICRDIYNSTVSGVLCFVHTWRLRLR